VSGRAADRDLYGNSDPPRWGTLIPTLLIRSSGDFFRFAAPKPIVPPGTPFPTGFTDLQAWIRNENLAPD
jgi:hypothetical protein